MTSEPLDLSGGLLRRLEERARAAVMAVTGGGRSSELVEVYRAANELEAQVVKGLLETNDIPVLLQGESLRTALAVTVGPLAEVRVLVPAPLAEQAQALLAQHGEEDLADQAEEPPEDAIEGGLLSADGEEPI
ncbi:MAG: DUF2007 domain-containing protein [Anaerolineae bacterium]|nr:DUF2007 domain-containing protein [Anaerolineae bacterium]